MAGGISFDFEFGKKRRDREKEAAAMAQSLLEKGAQPDTVNQVVSSFIKTGTPQYPQYETQALPPTADVSERSTRIPFNFAQKKKGLFSFDQGTGTFSQQETPDNLTDFDVKTFNSKPTKQGFNIWTVKQTGEVLRREPNETGTDHVIYVDPTSGSSKNPEDDLAKDVIKKYQAAVLKGEDIPDETMDSVRSAADRLGIDLSEVQKDPGILESIISKVSSIVPGVSNPAPKFGGSSVRFTSKGGKPLTKDLAQKFLQQSGGDKDKARQLAKQAGYTF